MFSVPLMGPFHRQELSDTSELGYGFAKRVVDTGASRMRRHGRLVCDAPNTTDCPCTPRPDCRKRCLADRRESVKHLPKYLQPRWRYLAVELEAWPDASIDREVFQRELWYSAQNLLGDTGSMRLDLSVLRFRYDSGTGQALVRTRRGEVESSRAVLACVETIDDESVGIRVRGVSGTVRACEEKYMGHAREKPEERTVVFGDAERSALTRNECVDVRTGDAFAGATTIDCN